MDNYQKLLNGSFRFLSYRPRSEKEVRDYLAKKKADDLTANRVIEKLKEHKFLDDKEFVKFWIEQRAKVKPKGIRFIKFELKQKGISTELLEEVLEDKDFETVSDFDKALNLAQKRVVRYAKEDPKKTYEKMARFLASKGFDWDIVKQVVDQVIPKGYNSGR